MEISKERRRKTELLRKEEHTALKKYVASFATVADAAQEIGINRQTLDRVLLIGKGSPESVQTIREKITPQTTA